MLDNPAERDAVPDLHIGIMKGSPYSLGFSVFNGDFQDIKFSRRTECTVPPPASCLLRSGRGVIGIREPMQWYSLPRLRMDLEGKTVVVTGAGSGVGRALAMEFGRNGARVVCAARREDRIQETAARIRQAGGTVYSCAKAGVARFTELLARELKHEGFSVLVFLMGPGFVRTEMTEPQIQTPAGQRWLPSSKEAVEEQKDRPPEQCAQATMKLIRVACAELSGGCFGPDTDFEAALRDAKSQS